MGDAGEAVIPRDQVKELAGFFAAHDRWLFGHACVRTQGDRELAADLVQDTFEAAAMAWSLLREHPVDRQRAWLLGTLAHKDISDLRRRAAFRRKQSEIHARYTATPADTEAEALNAIALARAREIIDRLPARQKEIALMRWRDRMRATEIAAALGIAEGTVHAQLHGARRKLVAGLERYYRSSASIWRSGTPAATTPWPRALGSCSGSPRTSRTGRRGRRGRLALVRSERTAR